MPSKKEEIKIQEFYLVTSEYCKLLENSKSYSKLEFLSKAQKIINLLYLKASLLIKPGDLEDGEVEKFVLERDWEFIKDQVSLKLAMSDKYIEVSIAEAGNVDNTETISISECFADIYQDLRDFSSNYDLGNENVVQLSLFDCLESFEKFWGIRALHLQVSIHNMIYNGIADNEENTANDEKSTDEDSKSTSNWLLNQRFKN